MSDSTFTHASNRSETFIFARIYFLILLVNINNLRNLFSTYFNVKACASQVESLLLVIILNIY